MFKKKTVQVIYFIVFLLMSAAAQTQIVEEAPWSRDEPPAVGAGKGPEFYLPLEFFGGNILNGGMGAAFLGRRLDFQFQGAFFHLRSDYNDSNDWTIDTYGFTLGGDISHHIPLPSGRFAVYYGILYRYNHIQENEYVRMADTHWTGFSLGGEFLKNERLTFYLENLWFLQNFYLDVPAMSLAGGIKFWLH